MQIAELRFGDVGRGLSHYKPVALAVAAIAVMGLTLPGPRRVTANAFGSAFGGASSAVGSVVAPGGSVDAAPPEVAAAVEAIETAPASSSGAFSSLTSSPSSPSASASSFGVDATVTRSDAEASSATFDSSAPPSTEGSRTVTAAPLRVTTSAWASAQAGTPVAAAGVPAGALPVGRRPGFSQDKVAFVRLAGTASVLKLVPHADASGARSAESAAIQACRITTGGWAKAEGQAMADAPKWDCGVSVLGARAADGSWTFDLSVFPERSDDRGFALVPAGDALDFQVAFQLA